MFQRASIILCSVLFLFSASGCSLLQNLRWPGDDRSRDRDYNDPDRDWPDRHRPDFTTPAPNEHGRRVVATGKRLAFQERRIYRGSCYTFVDGVYKEAGYPPTRRHIVFKGSSRGPYADPNLLRPGDWVWHVNYEFGGVGHSSIFIKWIDRDRKMAQTLDHAGMNRAEPGKYRNHSMAGVFRITRAGKK